MTKPRFRFRVQERSPGHTTFQMFVGQPGQGGNAGRLTLTNEEYDQLAPLLLAAPELLSAVEAVAALLDKGQPLDPEHDGLWIRAALDRAAPYKDA